MTIQSNKLYSLISEFPEDADAVKRLAEYVDSRKGKSTEISINRLFDLTRPNSKFNLARIIQRTIELGVVKEIIRIELEGLEEKKDYTTLEAIPKYVHDNNRNIDLEVRPNDLRMFYTLK